MGKDGLMCNSISKNYIASLVPKGAFILDVGSFNGVDAQELAEACNTVVHAFEPYPASYEAIKLLRDDRIIAWPYALGGYKGKVPMFIGKGHTQSNSIREPKKHKRIWPGIKFRNKVEVNITTLDDWFAMWCTQEPVAVIDFIWADCNGSEADFVAGGVRSLAVTKYLYMEYCAVELYDGAMDKEQTVKMMKGFDVMGEYNSGVNYGNLLFKNKNEGLWEQ